MSKDGRWKKGKKQGNRYEQHDDSDNVSEPRRCVVFFSCVRKSEDGTRLLVGVDLDGVAGIANACCMHANEDSDLRENN